MDSFTVDKGAWLAALGSPVPAAAQFASFAPTREQKENTLSHVRVKNELKWVFKLKTFHNFPGKNCWVIVVGNAMCTRYLPASHLVGITSQRHGWHRKGVLRDACIQAGTMGWVNTWANTGTGWWWGVCGEGGCWCVWGGRVLCVVMGCVGDGQGGELWARKILRL